MSWFRRTRREERPLSWWRAEIARRQILVVQQRVELELTKRKLEMARRPAGPDDYEVLRQLEIRYAKLSESLEQLRLQSTRKQRARDRLVVQLWEWSTRDRFEPPEKPTEERDPLAVC